MKKIFVLLALLCTFIAYGAYNVGDTVQPADNLSWTDNTGYSSNIFDELLQKQHVVMIFWGGKG